MSNYGIDGARLTMAPAIALANKIARMALALMPKDER